MLLAIPPLTFSGLHSILAPSIAPVCRRRTDCRAGERYIGIMSRRLVQWEQTRSLPEETSLPF